MGLGSALQAGLSGLNVAQRSIDVISNNIVNSSSEGYTRKIARQATVVLGGVGVGTQSLHATRMIDEGINKQLYKESGNLKLLSTKSDYLGRVENLFGSPESNTSLAHSFASLATAFENLACEVSSATAAVAQSTTVNAAKALFGKLNNLTQTIQNLRSEADSSISADIKEVNSILSSIEKLNTEIRKCNSLNTEVDDYLDQRDAAYHRLTELMNVQSFTRSNGEMIIMTGGGATLLDNNASVLVHNPASALNSFNTYSGGDIGGIYIGDKDITGDFRSGEIAGLINIRDSSMPELQAEVDELTARTAAGLNEINSRGIPYPAMKSTYTSDKVFLNINGNLSPLVNPHNAQTPNIKIAAGDVKIIVFDAEGKEVASTSLVQDLGFTDGSIYDGLNFPDNDSLLATIQNWLSGDPSGPALIGAYAKINENGYIEISTGDSSYSLAFRDEVSSIKGSSTGDASIEIDLDGDGVFDTTENGFVNALGLNNMITTTTNNWIYDSNVIAPGAVLNVDDAANLPVLNFSDERNIDFGSIVINPGDTITDIAARINADPALNPLLSAEIVKDGSGYRLRIAHKSGEELVITEPTTVTGTSIMKQLGLDYSAAGHSGTYRLSDDLENNYMMLSTGSIQYSQASGSYYATESDNTIANQFAEFFSETVYFETAGGISYGNMTLENYAASIVSQVANWNSTLDKDVTYQETLVSTLGDKSAAISGVNLDEELSNLMVYQMSYSAAARIVTTVSQMIDDLVNMV